MKTVLMGYELNKHTVLLVDNGKTLEVIYRKPGAKDNVIGIYAKHNLLEALDTYGTLRDAAAIVGGR